MKKFLCYDTNDAASGKIGVNSNGVLSPNATVPSTNGASYQQLVTDGSGNAKWEDRLAYETEPVITAIFKENTFLFVGDSEGAGASYMTESIIPESIAIDNNDIVTSAIIVWDGIEYKCTVSPEDATFGSQFYVGNGSIMSSSSEDTGEPFIVVIQNKNVLIVTKNTDENHVVSISFLTKAVHQIAEKFIPGNNILIGHMNQNDHYVESDTQSNTIRILDSNSNNPFRIVINGSFLSVQNDVFLRKIANLNKGSIKTPNMAIPSSVGEKYEFVENNTTIINALKTTTHCYIDYEFRFYNNITVYSYLYKDGGSGGFASAVVAAENGMVYSITLKLNSDNETANCVLKCIA